MPSTSRRVVSGRSSEVSTRIRKDADSDYGISFPDFPGAISASSDPDEARKMAAEALAFHLEGLAADGVVAPEPSSLEEVMSVADNTDGIAVLVEAVATC
jgi:predicted RNase H-like HicB family nuclease